MSTSFASRLQIWFCGGDTGLLTPGICAIFSGFVKAWNWHELTRQEAST